MNVFVIAHVCMVYVVLIVFVDMVAIEISFRYIVCVDVCSLIVIEEPNGHYSIDDRAHQDKARENSLFWVSINSKLNALQ